MSDACQPVIDIDGRKADLEEPVFKSASSKPAGGPGAGAGHPGGQTPIFYTPQSYDLVSSGRGSLTRPTSHIEVKLPWYKNLTWKDIRDIIPSLIILFFGLGVMIMIIPYAFSSVIKQLQQEADIKMRDAMDAKNRSLAAGND